jgi:hypothetical protein
MKRDFTRRTQERLKVLLQEADENWFGWTDALGDFFLGIGEQRVIDHLDDIESYQRALFDQNNTSSQDLQRIFDAVYTIDDTYSAIFASHAKRLAAFHERLKTAGASMINLSAYTTTTARFTDKAVQIAYRFSLARYADFLQQHPEAINTIREIALYESMHPEYVEQTNTFLSALPLADEIEIKRLIYQQGEPTRTLCLRYLDQFTIANTGVRGTFNPNNDTLVFNLAQDKTNPRGYYYTFFHELGHAIDWYYGLEQGYSGFYSDTCTNNGKTLMETNYDDVRSGLTARAYFLVLDAAYASLSPVQRTTIATHVIDNYWFNPDLTVNQGTNVECFAECFGRVMIDDPQSTDGLNSIGTYLPGSKTFMDQMLEGMD